MSALKTEMEQLRFELAALRAERANLIEQCDRYMNECSARGTHELEYMNAVEALTDMEDTQDDGHHGTLVDRISRIDQRALRWESRVIKAQTLMREAFKKIVNATTPTYGDCGHNDLKCSMTTASVGAIASQALDKINELIK